MKLKQLKDRVYFASYPRIIVICGPARAGTTALSHTFIRAGLESHMQPIKSILRAFHDEQEAPFWQVNGNPDRTILSKETLGTNLDCEYFNPVEVLVSLGYPQEKILPVLMVRNPSQTFSSWQELWGDFEGVRFTQVFQKMFEVMEYCDKHGIPLISFVHESIRNNSPDLVTSRVFERCRVTQSPRQVINWVEAPKFGDKDPENAHLFFYDSPPEKFISGVRNWGGYQYRDRPSTQRAREFVAQHEEVTQIYDTFLNRCQQDLGIII